MDDCLKTHFHYANEFQLTLSHSLSQIDINKATNLGITTSHPTVWIVTRMEYVSVATPAKLLPINYEAAAGPLL